MALFKIAGVLLDGTGTTLPSPQNVTFPNGEDVTFQLTVSGQNGTAINITGYTGTLTIKTSQSVSSTPAIASLALTLTAPTSGQGTFTLPGATSKGYTSGLLWYDVFITSGAGAKDEVVPNSLLTINYSVGM